jgi:hypothetical protein
MSGKLLRHKVFHNGYLMRVIKWHRKTLESELACTRNMIRAIQKNNEMIEDLKSCKRSFEELVNEDIPGPAWQPDHRQHKHV